MKKIFTITSAVMITAVIAVSCKSKTVATENASVLSAVDSAEFAAFQEWKEQQELKKMKEATTVRYVERRQTTANTTPAATTTQP
ncbi:MAG: hypothetical protein GXC73_05320, partial [Chitinophagaceae bacterium]|nr:hypothetical protein [Chitinophagaceae bacterium]